MADIVLTNISKRYQNEQIIDGFSYSYRSGGIYCVMGASGVGKTTLLQIITGLVQADEGRVQAEGRFSYVFQENRLVEELTPVTNVKMVLSGVKEEIICRELKQVLPQNCFYKKCSELSGGMKRRVAIVRAMMHPSDCIVMDEPFAGLDEASKRMTMEYILNNQNARTLIFVSHDREDAVQMNAEICLLTRE